MTTEAKGPEGFYVTMKRGERTAWLLGPYDTRAEAEERVPDGRRLARDVDPFTVFDGFGTSRLQMKRGAELPEGKLNGRLQEATSA